MEERRGWREREGKWEKRLDEEIETEGGEKENILVELSSRKERVEEKRRRGKKKRKKK